MSVCSACDRNECSNPSPRYARYGKNYDASSPSRQMGRMTHCEERAASMPKGNQYHVCEEDFPQFPVGDKLLHKSRTLPRFQLLEAVDRPLLRNFRWWFWCHPGVLPCWNCRQLWCRLWQRRWHWRQRLCHRTVIVFFAREKSLDIGSSNW